MFETESLPAATSGPVDQIIQWAGFADGVGTQFFAVTAGDYVTYTVNVPAAGMYDVKVAVKKASTRGQWQLSINESHVGTVQDEFDPMTVFSEVDVGTVTIASAGPTEFKFTVVGKNRLSTAYRVVFDYIKLSPH